MATFRFIPVPADDYDALGICADTIIKTHINRRGDLVIHVVTGDYTSCLTCDGDCESCPLAIQDCNEQCIDCPCYLKCAESKFDTEV